MEAAANATTVDVLAEIFPVRLGCRRRRADDGFDETGRENDGEKLGRPGYGGAAAHFLPTLRAVRG